MSASIAIRFLKKKISRMFILKKIYKGTFFFNIFFVEKAMTEVFKILKKCKNKETF